MLLTRHQFPKLLNRLNLLGEAVEVGVYEGDFSSEILSKWKGKLLHCVDPWRYQEDVIFDNSNVDQREHDAAYGAALANLQPFEDRVNIIRDFSVKAAEKFEDESLDFVFLDARHDYRAVTSDLRAWFPKVKIGGIFAGHDYKNSFVRQNLVEVKRSVDNFFIQRQRVRVTLNDNLPSWYVLKEKENPN